MSNQLNEEKNSISKMKENKNCVTQGEISDWAVCDEE